MDLFDFNHDGEVSDLERIMGLLQFFPRPIRM